ncbi:RCC1 domain-containing protein RUG3, mitochondrial isoform X2 [Prosopis cineraria]|uniref:RCC1 domain-containing protein RUG3, mitochondrial isoform X2 n=1 Tax=Prosopis cineraria TaxID=364024 RepID=UPI002410624F|nr:RCC1 domain-containing protein RUG3, mitochondrial isoform X2 [Prosopis cineraria]
MTITRRRFVTFTRLFSSSSAARKVPLLFNCNTDPNTQTDATTTLQVLSWGRGASGQLGGGTEEIRLYPSPVANLLVPKTSFILSQTPGKISRKVPDGEDIGPSGEKTIEVGISCGLFHSSLIVDGTLWIWGKGDGGRLGLGHENPMFVPTLNPHIDSLRCVAFGGLHSVALTSSGEVFTWGYGGFGALGHSVYHRELFPRLVKGSWEGTIQHIATSGTHTAAVTGSGELYIWGRDEGDGRLGLGPGRGPDHAGGLSIPSKVKELPFPIAAVSCGGFFTMALTEDGQVWNWGDDGKVLSWGHGGQGQLGNGSLQNQRIPTVIEALAHEHVVYISCGGSSSAAVTDEGKLYMWGNANDSQLGVPGLPDVQPSPVEVNFLTEDDGLGPHKVLSVSIGASHAMCLALKENP